MTNSTAMTALQTLRTVSSNMATTQSRISTGFRVATASDNAAYWSIATTMRSDNMALSAVQDALGLGAATIDTMYTGLNGTVSVVSQIKAKLVAARTPGVDRGKIQSEITELQKQLKNTADSAVFNGENWISVDSTSASYNASKTVVSSFSRVGGSVKIDTLAVNLDAIKLYDGNLDTAYNAQTFPTANTASYAAATDVGGNITVTVGASPAINIAVAANTSLADIATAINKLKIDGLSVGVNKAGDQLSFMSRNDSNVVIDASVSGLGAAVTLTALAAPVDTKKGILD
jgi:flagellin